MKNFDLRKYLAEGKLLKEDMSIEDVYNDAKRQVKDIYNIDVPMDVVKQWADNYQFPYSREEDPEDEDNYILVYDFGTEERGDFMVWLKDNYDGMPLSKTKTMGPPEGQWDFSKGKQLKEAEGRLFEENSFTAKEISRGKASSSQSNDIGDYQFGVKVLPRRSYRDEEDVKNNVMTVKKIDKNPQNPRSIIATLLSDEKVEKQYEPADLYLYKEGE